MTQNQNTTTFATSNPSILGFATPNQHFGKKTESLKPTKTIMIEKGKLRICIPVQNILFVKAEHVYCRLFFSNDQRVLQRISLEKLLDKLPEDTFIQVHRSFLVNVNHISKFNSSKVMVGDTVIPIGRTWKEKVVPVLKQVSR